MINSGKQTMSWISCSRNGRNPRCSVAALGVGFLLALSAYRGLASLQSSINPSGLGTSSLAGTALIFSGTLLLLTTTGEKVDRLLARRPAYVMATSVAVCSSYVLAQTLLPPSPATPGVETYVGAVVWSSGATGVAAAVAAHCSLRYLALLHEHPQLKVASTAGLFVVLGKMATIGGNLVSSTVLSTLTAQNTSQVTENFTETCGVKFWPGDKYVINNDISNLNRPSNYVINWICGIYFGLMALSVLIITLGVEDPIRDQAENAADTIAVVHVLGDSYETDADNTGDDMQQDTLSSTLLLAPMLLSLGIGQAFLEADVTSAYVTCTLGLKYVGWTMICHSLLDGLGLAIGYYVVKQNVCCPLRVTVTLAAILMHLTFVCALHTSTLSAITIFGAVSAFGVGSGVLLAIATLGRTTSLATSMLFKLVGLILGYSYSVYLRTEVKLYIVMVSTLLGFLGFLAAEFKRTPPPEDAALKAQSVIT